MTKKRMAELPTWAEMEVGKSDPDCRFDPDYRARSADPDEIRFDPGFVFDPGMFCLIRTP